MKLAVGISIPFFGGQGQESEINRSLFTARVITHIIELLQKGTPIHLLFKLSEVKNKLVIQQERIKVNKDIAINHDFDLIIQVALQ